MKNMPLRKIIIKFQATKNSTFRSLKFLFFYLKTGLAPDFLKD
jgi:hypothetical protein